MSGDNENGAPGATGSGGGGSEQPPTEHLNIKVTDNNNEVFFKIKRSTKLEKLMTAFCERQGKALTSVRFLFDGTRVQPSDTPEAVRLPNLSFFFSPNLCVGSAGSHTPHALAHALAPCFSTASYCAHDFIPPHEHTAADSPPPSSSKCKTAIPSKFTRSRLAVARQDRQTNTRNGIDPIPIR